MTTPPLFDRRFISQQHGRRSPLHPDHRFLFDHVERDALARLDFLKQKPKRVAIHGRRPSDCVAGVDRFKFTDDERMTFMGTPRHTDYDLILSPLSLHAINDVPAALMQMKSVLSPQGVLLACVFGENTLVTLRQALATAESDLFGNATPRVYPFAPASSWAGQLQKAGYALPVADAESLTIYYRTLRGLLTDLRMMGEANGMTSRSRRPLSPALIDHAEMIYKSLHPSADGLMPATFDIVWMMGFRD